MTTAYDDARIAYANACERMGMAHANGTRAEWEDAVREEMRTRAALNAVVVAERDALRAERDEAIRERDEALTKSRLLTPLQCGANPVLPPERVGCGKWIGHEPNVYRCVDCGVPFHKACLAKHCEDDLAKARSEVERLTALNPDGISVPALAKVADGLAADVARLTGAASPADAAPAPWGVCDAGHIPHEFRPATCRNFVAVAGAALSSSTGAHGGK